MARIVLATLAILSVLVLLQSVAAAPSCATIDSHITPCVVYIEGAGTSPSTTCCRGLKDVVGGIKGKDDKVGVCNCVKDVVTKLSHVDSSRISDLGKMCGIVMNLPPIDKNYDCSKIA